MTFTHALGTNNYGPTKFVVATSAANGTHTTLASAMTAASSGDTIFLRDSVTENVTITPGVNIACWSGDSLNVPTITGTLTMTGAGTSTISGLKLTTNSAALIAVTGSAASILNVNNCYINCSNNSGITFSTSNGSAQIALFNCKGDLGTTGIKIFDHTSAGTLDLNNCWITNSGASTTASTISAGNIRILFSRLFSPITSSGTGSVGINGCNIDCSAQNATCLTIGGSGNGTITNSNVVAGSASAISISASFNVNTCAISSSNTNAITGAGTILYSGISFTGSSTTINTTTQTTSGTLQGSKNTAPTSGMLGEQISNSASSVATTSTTPKSITSIALTAGVWDVSAISYAQATGGAVIMSAHVLSISATDNTLAGTVGIQQFQLLNSQVAMSGVVPQFRVVVSSTTNYYAVVQNNYTSTTCPTNARITATRVG